MSYISNATDRLTDLINTLLDYSNLGKGQEKTTVDFEQLLKIRQQDLAHSIEETNTTVEVGELPKLKGYETALRLLFQNLISISIKSMKSTQYIKNLMR